MSYPDPYEPNYRFTELDLLADFGPRLDTEFSNLSTLLGLILQNQQVLQREDTALANASVHPDAMNSALLAAIQASAGTFNPRGAWVTLTDYAVGDTVVESEALYLCLIAHTSGTFSTDLAALRWVKISATAPDPISEITVAVATGGPSAYAIAPGDGAYADNEIYFVSWAAANTGPVTLNRDANGAKDVRYNGRDLYPGEIGANTTSLVRYDASLGYYEIQSVIPLTNRPAGFVGLEIRVTGSDAFTLSADSVTLKSDQGNVLTANAISEAVTFSAILINSATESNSTWYDVYLYGSNPASLSVGCVAAGDNPGFGSSQPYILAGQIYNDGSGNLIFTTQIDDVIRHDDHTVANAVNPSTSISTHSVRAPSGCREVFLTMIGVYGSATGEGKISIGDATHVIKNQVMWINSGATAQSASNIPVRLRGGTTVGLVSDVTDVHQITIYQTGLRANQ